MSALKAIPLSGQVALVTGGGTGIGLMIAKGLAENGAKVYITGRREQVLQDATASLTDAPGLLVPLVMNVTSQESIDSGVKIVEEAEGKLDILVNNAGNSAPLTSDPVFFQKKLANLASGGDPLAHESFDGWTELFTLNASAPFFVIASFQGLLTKAAEGRNATSSVINISSSATEQRSWMPVTSFAYRLTKSALDAMTIGLATNYAQRKIPIRVNAIHPGTFPSEMMPPEMLAPGFVMPGFVAPIPLGRVGIPVEMAQTAVYLATSEYTNGVILRLDGGLTLVNP